jgi:metal-sulfur cluster biosynthetic enzyme
MDAIPQRYLRQLSEVFDPCCRDKGISVVDLGLVHAVSVSGRHARVELLLTSGWCPFAAAVLTEVRERMEALPEVDSAEVEVVWHTPWTTDRLSDSARRRLRFLPDPVAVGDRDEYVTTHRGEPGHDR